MTLTWKRVNKTEKNKRTKKERFEWFIERIQTRVAFGWLSERSGEKTSCPKNFPEISRYFALTSYRNTIGQLINASSLLGFSLTGKGRGHFFYLFIYGLIKQITNTYRNHNQGHTKISPSGEVWTETAQNWNKSFTHFKHRTPERLAESFVH